MIELTNVSFSYGQKEVINNISVTIPSNQFVSIIGPNGCGKSTLLKLLAKDLDYQQGSIELEGKAIVDYSTKDYAKLLAFNRQHLESIPPFTCLDYVLMGRRPYKAQFEDYTKEDLQLTENILSLTQTMPFLEKHLNEVSGGELQRINLAKNLIQETLYLLLDESFSAMDIFFTVHCLNILKEFVSSGKSIVCVMHDLNFVYQYSDYVILMNNGRVIATGKPKEVLSTSAIKKTYGIDVEYIEDKGFIIQGG